MVGNIPPEALRAPAGIEAGANVIGATRGGLGNLATAVSHNTVAPAAAPLLGTAAALAGGLLTGVFVWKGLDIMVRGPQALPSIIRPHG